MFLRLRLYTTARVTKRSYNNVVAAAAAAAAPAAAAVLEEAVVAVAVAVVVVVAVVVGVAVVKIVVAGDQYHDGLRGKPIGGRSGARTSQERVVQICQSDHILRLHALATILGHKRKGHHRRPYIVGASPDVAELHQDPSADAVDPGTQYRDEESTWADAMTARLMVDADGQLTISLGQGRPTGSYNFSLAFFCALMGS